ncbi:MAG TPA: TIGR03086 family metal-binding protein [Nocardioidaceae bacterium]|nr:TIGR03086 family metal-binding protein [Nocardioidaceae bacterium]
MDPKALHRRTVEEWAERVAAVGADQWDLPTPCAEWNVRDLVNHVVGEELWTVPLVAGASIEEVGTRFDGDLLGTDPTGVTGSAAAGAANAADKAPDDAQVQLSFGDTDLGEYLYQLAADHLIHGWDLAMATGGATALDPEAVDEVASWFREREELYRDGGAIGPRQAPTGDRTADLLAAFGRSADWGPNHAALARFSAAFGSGDVDAIMALMTEDCVFESTGPGPDGARVEGQADVRRVWEELFGGTAGARFDEEESFVSGDRAVLRWRYSWTNGDGSPGYVRGVDVLRLRDGKVAEKLSYVKG